MKPLCFINKQLIYPGKSPLHSINTKNRAKLLFYELNCITMMSGADIAEIKTGLKRRNIQVDELYTFSIDFFFNTHNLRTKQIIYSDP